MATVTPFNKHGWSRRDILEYKLTMGRRDEWMQANASVLAMNLPVAYLSSDELDAWADRPYYTRPWYNDAKVKIPMAPFAHNKHEREAHNHIENSEDPYVTQADRDELSEHTRHSIEVNRKQEQLTAKVKRTAPMKEQLGILEHKRTPVHTEAGLVEAYNNRFRGRADNRHFWESVKLFLMMNLYGTVFAGEGGYRNVKEIKSAEDFVHDTLSSVIENVNSPRSAETFYSWLHGLGRNTQRTVHKEYATVRRGEDPLTAHLKRRKVRVRDEVALMGASSGEQIGDGLGTTFQESDEAIEGTNREDLRRLRLQLMTDKRAFRYVAGMDYAILELLQEREFEYSHIATFTGLKLSALKKRIERLRKRIAKVVAAEAEDSLKAA